MDICAQFVYLRSPHIHTPASGLKHFITQLDLEMQVFEVLRYFWPQENKGNINTMGKNRALDIHVPSVQRGAQTSESDWFCCIGCSTNWFLLPATNR